MGILYVENGLSGDPESSLKSYTWNEISQHSQSPQKWIVIDGYVYDISNFQKKHPGGARIISHFAGQDATDEWVAMHKDRNLVLKYMNSLLIGKVCPHDIGHHDQAQSGWSQHDYGHLSVFSTSRLNHWMHWIVIGHLKGASSHWWNFRHNQHHCKPNIIGKDPDIGAAYLFLVGKKMPVQWAERHKGFMPYDWQHIYFWLLGPPTLLTIYFHLENVYFMVKRKDYVEIFWSVTFFVRFFYCYSHLLGVWGAFWLYMLIRLIEGHWFVLVTQMNHIPMEIDREKNLDFVTAQSVATCNIEPSWFNDWFTGHLNFQIEHHLFPTMPRHNYAKVAPLIKSLFAKHRLLYSEKSLRQGVFDIFWSLKDSGQIWRQTYNATDKAS